MPTNNIFASISAEGKVAFYLFLIVMALNGSFPLFNAYFSTSSIDHRLISVMDDSRDDARGASNVGWDELSYIPRLNSAALGRFFADPWNSHNESYVGWGAFGLLPPILAGAFISVFEHHYLSLGIWALCNFFLLALVFVRLFTAAPLVFSQSASVLMTFIVMSFLWLASWPLKWFNVDLVISIFLRGDFVSAETDIEAGLLTYLFYALFLMSYWHFVASPCRRRALVMGAAAGLLTYVYFFHFIFAFGMIAAHLAVSAYSRDTRSSRLGLVALGAGLILAAPYLINSYVFANETASALYQERLSYSAGRNPIPDYRWFVNFALPFAVGLSYLWLRPASEIKTVIVRTWVVIALAYALVLNVRVVLGYMQAEDHFWRQSLGMPATLWCVAAAADLARSRLGELGLGRQLVIVIALALPVLVLARTAAKAVKHFVPTDTDIQLTSGQKAILGKVECMEKVLRPGEGFLTDEPALNYHVMANLKGIPFMAMGLSPVTVEELTTRYLLSSYLLGKDGVMYPPAGRAGGYVHTVDPHLYLYVNLFQDPAANPEAEERVRNLYRAWKPEKLQWNEWWDALASVKAVYVPEDRMDLATTRLERVFAVERTEPCAMGNAFRLARKFGDPEQPD